MTTLEHLPQSDLLPMELPSMSLQAGSRAKTLALLESKPELGKAHAADCGANACVLLAKYDPNTQSLRTSQTCFLDQQENPALGLAEFCQTWPASGMMRSGKIYQRQPWALPIAENVSGLLPTPFAGMYRTWRYRATSTEQVRRRIQRHQTDVCALAILEWGGRLSIEYCEALMGFPPGHTELKPSETP
jgi:hypothetical protein